MKLLGLPLRTPGMPDLFNILVIAILATASGHILVALGLGASSDVQNWASAAAGGALASASGVEYPRDGWRGAVIMIGFAFGLMLLVRALTAIS